MIKCSEFLRPIDTTRIDLHLDENTGSITITKGNNQKTGYLVDIRRDTTDPNHIVLYPVQCLWYPQNKDEH